MSNLKVSEWDGIFDEAPAPVPNLRQDVTFFRAGTSVSGQIIGFKDGLLNFAATPQAGEISLDRVRNIQFSTPATPEPNLKAGLARAHFATGGTLTAKIERWNATNAVVVSPRIGKLELNPSAFGKLEF